MQFPSIFIKLFQLINSIIHKYNYNTYSKLYEENLNFFMKFVK